MLQTQVAHKMATIHTDQWWKWEAEEDTFKKLRGLELHTDHRILHLSLFIMAITVSAESF